MTRREALRTLGAAGGILVLGCPAMGAGEVSKKRTTMGIVTYAFGIHQKHQWGGRYPGLPHALALLEEAHRLGTAGIQVDLEASVAAHADELRKRAEDYGMFIEAGLNPPSSKEDVARFEKNIQLAKRCGATLGRTVIMPGRRYEQFKSYAEFREFEKRGLQSLQWAEPVLARHKFPVGVENHKDQRIHEKLDTLKRLNSEFIGVCVDVGNNFTLMEEPLDTVRAFAPYAVTVHFKDQAVREKEDGFWFADVALGEGFIDLPAVVKVLQQAKPDIHLNLETITRDPLNVPVLTGSYWATLPDTPASELARAWRTIKTRSCSKPFVRVSELPVEQQLALELKNVETSILYAREKLGLVP